jgi:hypothetical protein
MATVNKRLCKGVLTNSPATYYTVPVATSTAVKAITVCNKTNTTTAFTISFAGTYVVYNHSLEAYDTITIPFMDQILEATEVISMVAGANTAIEVYITGAEF